MPRVLRLTVFQYLPFFSYALPLAPIGALGIGVLPLGEPIAEFLLGLIPTTIYPLEHRVLQVTSIKLGDDTVQCVPYNSR